MSYNHINIMKNCVASSASVLYARKMSRGKIKRIDNGRYRFCTPKIHIIAILYTWIILKNSHKYIYIIIGRYKR